MIICKHCGEHNPEGSRFCSNCGNPILANTEPITKSVSEPRPKASRSKIIIIISVIAALLIVGGGLLIVLGQQKTKIDLNKYIYIDVYGYDGIGKAELSFDDVAFIADYEEKIHLSKEKENVSGTGGYDRASLLLQECVSYSLNKDTDLTNGEEIELTWECDDDVANDSYNCELVYSDITKKVDGLAKVDTIDPFRFVKIDVRGISPEGYVEISVEEDREELDDVSFSVDKENGLANGDKIVVTAELDIDQEEYIENFGAILSPLEKEIEVEELPYYAQSAKEIPEDTLNKMKKQAEDAFRTKIAENIGDATVNSYTYLGNVFLSRKKDSDAEKANMIYLVYKADITLYDYGCTYYHFYQFNDISLNTDGTCDVDIGQYSEPTHSFMPENPGFVSLAGFEKLGDIDQECITINLEDYTYEDNVDR